MNHHLKSGRTILRQTTQTDLQGGDCFIRVEIPHPIQGNDPIVFETPVFPAEKAEWARSQAQRQANELLNRTRRIPADPFFISYLKNDTRKAA